MDPELEQRIRDAYAAFVECDIDRLREFWHGDATYRGRGRQAGLRYGTRDEAAAAAGL